MTIVAPTDDLATGPHLEAANKFPLSVTRDLPPLVLAEGCERCGAGSATELRWCDKCILAGLGSLEHNGDLTAQSALDYVRSFRRNTSTSVYRYFDADDVLLYVGMANNPDSRRSGHVKNSAWYRFAATWSVEWYSTRDLAAFCEMRAIGEERPVFNRAGADAERAERARNYLLAKRAFDLMGSAI